MKSDRGEPTVKKINGE